MIIDNSRSARLIKMYEDIKIQKRDALAKNEYETLASLRDLEKRVLDEIDKEELKSSIKKG